MNDACDYCYVSAYYVGHVGNGDKAVRACKRHVNKALETLAERADRVVGNCWTMQLCYEVREKRRTKRINNTKGDK